MGDWADREFDGLSLGDVRRSRRTIKVARALAEQPGHTIPQACGSWADTEGAYRLFENEHVPASAILEEHYRHTALRAANESMVLVIADATELDYSGLRMTEGLGLTATAHGRGLHLFDVLVASAANQPLGLIDAKFWSRDPESRGKAKERAKKPTSEKESQMWLDGLAHAQQRLPVGLPFVYVADAEADLFDLFAAPRREGVHLLVRAHDPRRHVEHPAVRMEDAVRSFEPCGQFTIAIGRGGNRREGRLARLVVRYARLTALAPKGSVAPLAESADIYVVLAEEEGAPDGEKPIHWLLITTLPVTSFEEARRRTEQYARRWLIERYHFTLKSGCRVEDLQLTTAGQLIRAVSLMAVVAWRITWLMHEGRLHPHEPCTSLVSDYEWKALYAYHYPHMRMPAKPPTLREAIRLIARIGGFLARKGDGEPGVKTIWLGFAELERLARLYRSIANNPALCIPTAIQ